jgi:hypothetical protein
MPESARIFRLMDSVHKENRHEYQLKTHDAGRAAAAAQIEGGD